jgi:hypothetical protein
MTHRGTGFTIDQQAGTVGYPAGYRVHITASGQASFGIRCQRCPPPRDHPRVRRQLPALAADGGTVDRLAGRRRVPYHGIQRNHMWLSVRVAALNLRRLLILGLTRRDEAWVLA